MVEDLSKLLYITSLESNSCYRTRNFIIIFANVYYWTLCWSQFNLVYIFTHTDYEINFNIILSFRSNIIRRRLRIVKVLSIHRLEISRYFSLGSRYSP
jgi:hypothetical protein